MKRPILKSLAALAYLMRPGAAASAAPPRWLLAQYDVKFSFVKHYFLPVKLCGFRYEKSQKADVS